jgi:hypothetical protein
VGVTRAPIVAERPAAADPPAEDNARKLAVTGPDAALPTAPGGARVGARVGAPEAQAALAASAPPATSQVTTTTYPYPTEDEWQEPLQRVFHLGFAGGGELGLSVRLAFRQEAIALEYSVDRLKGNGKARTLGLLGGGAVYPLRRQLDLVVVGVCGVDALDRPEIAFTPVLGTRVGLEWKLERGAFHSASLSVTSVVDLARPRTMALEVGGASFYATVGTGFMIADR